MTDDDKREVTIRMPDEDFRRLERFATLMGASHPAHLLEMAFDHYTREIEAGRVATRPLWAWRVEPSTKELV
jgi:predicted transcriptional regulator